MHILFVDIDFHLTTKSADFFLKILRSFFEVETHYYHAAYDANIPQEKIDRADIIIVWQTMLERKDFVVNGKPCIFIPMYDDDWGSRFQWKRIGLSGAHIISFCNAISKRAIRGGVPSNRLLDLRFAYNPDDFNGFEGDPDVAAIWDRGFFGMHEFKQMFPPRFFKKILLIRRPQPDLRFQPISQNDKLAYNIVIIESEFIPKQDYLQLIKEPGVFLAPRPKEGIGMSFLEALAMGKCVIAHDDASMNEYIIDGKNGLIRNFYGNIFPISKADILSVRNYTKTYSKAQYNRWIADKEKIVSFINETALNPPVKIGGWRDVYHRALYAFEALYCRAHSALGACVGQIMLACHCRFSGGGKVRQSP